jgi:rhomboid protease GluP
MGETAEYWVHDTYHNELDTRDITPQEFRPLLESLEYYVAEGENAFLQKTQKKNLLSRENLLRMTNLIVLVNILVFIWLEMEGSTQNTMFMLEHGAMYLPYMKEYGQWYRLLSSMFMHFGIVHLINNMVVLFCIGGDLERAMGKIRYLILYLVSGVASNLVSCQYYETVGKNVVSCGASGAIFGVIGGLLFVVISNKGRYENLSMRRMILFVILSIYSGMSTPNVNMAAHLSGLIVGFFVAAFLYNRKKNGDSMEEVK